MFTKDVTSRDVNFDWCGFCCILIFFELARRAKLQREQNQYLSKVTPLAVIPLERIREINANVVCVIPRNRYKQVQKIRFTQLRNLLGSAIFCQLSVDRKLPFCEILLYVILNIKCNNFHKWYTIYSFSKE